MGVFVTRFSWFGELDGLREGSQTPFEWMVLLRGLVLVACVLAWVLRAPEPLRDDVEPDTPTEPGVEPEPETVDA